jgi:hypothetical protein
MPGHRSRNAIQPSVIEFCHIYQEEYGFKHCLVAVCSGFCKRQHEDLPLGRCINNTTPNMCCCREENDKHISLMCVNK